MPVRKIVIMGVHGLGDHRRTSWHSVWEQAIRAAFPSGDELELEFRFVTYDPIFEKTQITGWDTAKALWKLTRSAVTSSFRREKGVLDNVSDAVRWTAGYVVAWVENEAFQKATRKLILNALAEHQPDVLLGHSLGSLVTYDALTHDDAQAAPVQAVLRKLRYVTLGSQIGNPFVVRNLTPGRIVVPPVKHWCHLYNAEDDVFTAPIRIYDSDHFSQIDTPFDIDGFADHAAESYLGHSATRNGLWMPIADEARAGGGRARAFGAPPPQLAARRAKAPPAVARKALLIGINDYPNPEDRLEGCVNDVFRMSEVLQECGFPAASIRVCLNERATAKGILERLKWLLDDPRPNQELVFFYSGHGAQIPEYGELNEPDRNTETLVPYDFDWSPEHAITDDQIYRLYSQLPYDTRFAMIFDCCHSGGIHRDGGHRAKGLTPPDDIRHREIEWNREMQMWVPRGFSKLNGEFSKEKTVNRQFFGARGTSVRLGRASALRGQPEARYEKEKSQRKTSEFGPYLPLIIEACQEGELSYEYRHGVTSFGAFTFCLSTLLRQRKKIAFQDLVTEAGKQLKSLNYEQTPQVLGPKSVTSAVVPWK